MNTSDDIGDELQSAADAFAEAVARVEEFQMSTVDIKGTTVEITLIVDTEAFPAGDAGFPVLPSERIQVGIDRWFPFSLGHASVDHFRWLGYPHVLLGTRLCLYLDPDAEWDPETGAEGFVARLWEWLAEAIAGEFDPITALYHPIGGVLRRTKGAPTLVVELPLLADRSELEMRRILLKRRSAHRIDVASWHRTSRVDFTHTGVLVVLPAMLPFGAPGGLSFLTSEVGRQQSNGARKRLIKKLRQTADGLAPNDPLQVVFAVPNPARSDEGRLHLIAASIPHDNITDALAAARERGPNDAAAGDEPEVEWLYVDDVRHGVHTRRDTDRPVEAFRGLTVELWGCGALGSWLAELLVRAGVAQITLRDPGLVTKGLLLRQNYTEFDVGRPKVDALADRLRALDSSLVVQSFAERCESALASSFDCDLIIDATVNTRTASFVDSPRRTASLSSPVIQVATDVDTATLGIVTICQPQSGHTNSDVDEVLRQRCESDDALLPFRQFWNRDQTPPLTPSPGCSVPTFRGSGADAVAVAADALSLIAIALRRGGTGGYVFGTAHASLAAATRAHVAIEPLLDPDEGDGQA